MSKTYFASDHHFGHAKILTFTYNDLVRDKTKVGKLIRPNFNTIEDHDTHIIKVHNSIVNDDDLVYFLGDIAWKTNKNALSNIAMLKGRKRITLGNHDDGDWLFKTGLFEHIYLWKYFPDDNFIASHVPLAAVDLKRGGGNVHGHTHGLDIQEAGYIPIKHSITDNELAAKYVNVSMEAIDYKPLELSEVKTRLAINNGLRK